MRAASIPRGVNSVAPRHGLNAMSPSRLHPDAGSQVGVNGRMTSSPRSDTAMATTMIATIAAVSRARVGARNSCVVATKTTAAARVMARTVNSDRLPKSGVSYAPRRRSTRCSVKPRHGRYMTATATPQIAVELTIANGASAGRRRPMMISVIVVAAAASSACCSQP